MNRAFFEIKKNAVGRYYFVFGTDEKHFLVVAESFGRRSELEKCISDLREAATVAEICVDSCNSKPPLFDIIQKDSGFICRLTGFTGKQIFTSELYQRKEDCVAMAKEVKLMASDAGIIDNAT